MKNLKEKFSAIFCAVFLFSGLLYFFPGTEVQKESVAFELTEEAQKFLMKKIEREYHNKSSSNVIIDSVSDEKTGVLNIPKMLGKKRFDEEYSQIQVNDIENFEERTHSMFKLVPSSEGGEEFEIELFIFRYGVDDSLEDKGFYEEEIQKKKDKP